MAILIGVAAGLRLWPLEGLDNRLTWLTFYPMVMISALLGGLATSGLAVALTVGLTMVWGPTGTPFGAGPTYWLGAAVFIFNGVLIGAMGEGMRRARARLAEAKEQAEIANQSKSAFLAHMSHELRTPLNSILGFSRLLSGDATVAPEQRTKLELINRSGQHLLTMINDVLDFSKIEAGKETIQNDPFHLRAALEDAAEIAQSRAIAKDLAYHVETDDVDDLVVVGDRGKLCQVLINLLGNAVKFTDEGGVAMRAKTAALTGDTLELQVEVEDTGPGISQDQIDKIFDPFIQTGSSFAQQQGTGLGLAISKNIMDLFGGSLDVASTLGNGSLFTVSLPLAISPDQEVEDKQEQRHLPNALAPGQTDWRVLIVDDDAANRLLLESQLHRVGLNARLAMDGSEAVRLYEEWSPHFIWMDIRMPVMDGYEATRTIRQLPGGDQVKIVAITASVFKDQIPKIFEAGCDAVMHKPYREQELFEMLTKYLGMAFVYDEVSPTPARAPRRIDIAAEVSRIPPDLVDRMRAAVRDCDVAAMQALIDEVPADQTALAQGLRIFLDEFDWDLLERHLGEQVEGTS